MSTYKHGSFNLSHENVNLNSPSIQWLGIQSQDVLAGNGEDEYTGLLRLSARDRKKAADMLAKSEFLQENGEETQWRRELQVMLMLNVKAEMEILAEREGGVKRWVEEKLIENGTNLYADENLLETHQLEDMTLGEDNLRSLCADDESLLDTHEMPEMSAVGESLQADRDLLEAHQLGSMSLADDGSPSSQPDEELLDTYQLADMSLADEEFPSFEWDEEL